MASLAQKLNELATANSEGLLDDDEYRLLRQDIFERYSGGNVAPVESAVVPVSLHSKSLSTKQVEFISNPPPPRPASPVHRYKPSVASEVVSFLRKATGRKTSSKVPPPALPLSPSNHGPSSTLKRTFLPKVLSRKPSSEGSIRSTSTSRMDAFSLSSHKASLSVGSDTLTSPPVSPTRIKGPATSTSSKFDLSSPPADDIFEDGGLTSTQEIRQAITATEIEGRKVVDAFNSLEMSTLSRNQRPSMPRRPSALPAYLAASSSSSSTLFPEPVSARQRSGSDGVSVRSISSEKTTWSVSRSFSSRRAVSPVAQPLKRKASVSSLASQTTSLLSPRSNLSNSWSRSTGHLPMTIVAESEAPPAVPDIPEGATEEEMAVLADIRRRKLEVIARYQARLEYLKARLKGAELHEKLLRR